MLSQDNILESVSCGILVVDKDLHIIELNPTAERITGYLKEQIAGHKGDWETLSNRFWERHL